MKGYFLIASTLLIFGFCILPEMLPQAGAPPTKQADVNQIYANVFKQYGNASKELWTAICREGAKDGYKVPCAGLAITMEFGALDAQSNIVNGKATVSIGQDLIVDSLRLAQVTVYVNQSDHASPHDREHTLGDYIEELADSAVRSQREHQEIRPRELGAFLELTPAQSAELATNKEFGELSDYLFQLMIASVLGHEYGHLARRDSLKPSVQPESQVAIDRELAADKVGRQIVSKLYQNDVIGASLTLLFRMAYQAKRGEPTRELCHRALEQGRVDFLNSKKELLANQEGQNVIRSSGRTPQEFADLQNLLPVSAVCDRLSTDQPSLSVSDLLDKLTQATTNYNTYVPSFTCIETVHSEQISAHIPNGRWAMNTQAELRVLRTHDSYGALEEKRIFTLKNGQQVSPTEADHLVLPYFLADAFGSPLDRFLASEQRPCLLFTPFHNELVFRADPTKAGRGACIDITPGTRGNIRYDPMSNTVTHLERSVPLSESQSRNLATFAAVDFAALNLNGSTYRIPAHILGMREMGQDLNYFDAHYTSCKKFDATVRILPGYGIAPE